MKKKYYFVIGFTLLLTAFFASPYILDAWQWKGVLSAVGSPPIYEGITGHQTQKCQTSCYPAASCCVGNVSLCSTSEAPACVDFGMTVIASAGGQPCKTGYLLNPTQVSMVQGSNNIILAGTVCNDLSLVASGKGCIGCTSAINNPKVYAYKNAVKRIINFIIAGKKD